MMCWDGILELNCFSREELCMNYIGQCNDPLQYVKQPVCLQRLVSPKLKPWTGWENLEAGGD